MSVRILTAAFPDAALRDFLACGHRANERSFRWRSPVQGAELWGDFRLFLSGSQPAANVHRWSRIRCHFFLSGSQPPPTNVQQVSFNEPVHAARPSEVPFICGSLASKKEISRKRRCAQTDHKPGVHCYPREEWILEWTTSKRPTPKHSRPPLIRGRWRRTRTNLKKILLVEETHGS